MNLYNLTFPSGESLLCSDLQHRALTMGLNCKTYFLLWWVANKMHSDQTRQIIDGERYHMIDYDEISNALPMIARNRDTMRNELFGRLGKLNFIVRKQSPHGIGIGTRTGIVLGAKYHELFTKPPESHFKTASKPIDGRITANTEQTQTANRIIAQTKYRMQIVKNQTSGEIFYKGRAKHESQRKSVLLGKTL